MAEAGYFVMSLNWGRPPNDLTTSTIDELNEKYSNNGREIVWKLIQSGMDHLISEGKVDGNRVALTGLSAGAEIVNYVLQRTNRFRAAIASSAMQDLTFFSIVPEGPLRTRLMAEFKAQDAVETNNARLNEIAWSNKPDKLRTPFLINVGEYEALLGFEGTQAIAHAGGPLEMRIFPDEEHIKYHPWTYIGIYQNNMRWLRFWLSGEIDPNPALAEQYKRWKAMENSTAKP